MTTRLANRHFDASMRLLRRVEARCALLPALGELRTMSELTARARIVRSALNARSLFEDFRKNLSGLSAALADYQARKSAIDRRAGAATAMAPARNRSHRPPR